MSNEKTIMEFTQDEIEHVEMALAFNMEFGLPPDSNDESHATFHALRKRFKDSKK